MANNPYTYESITLYSTRAILTEQPINRNKPIKTGFEIVKANKKYTLSEGAKKAIKKKIEAWTDTSFTYQKSWYRDTIYRLFFITLTLPSTQIHCDCTINKEALQPFLKELTRMFGGTYFWVTERQKNGNIHYHIIYDRAVSAQRIRSLWNNSINRLGYVNRYQQKMQSKYSTGYYFDPSIKADNSTQFRRYTYGQATNWTSPNSTDNKQIKDPKKVSGYIAKYVSKSDSIFCGRIYGNSEHSDYIKPYSSQLTEDIEQILKDSYKDRIISEHCSILKHNHLEAIIRKVPEVDSHYRSILNKLRAKEPIIKRDKQGRIIKA